jgi:hypothetical protein
LTGTVLIFIKFGIWLFLENLPENVQVSLKPEKNKGYFKGRAIHIFDHMSLSYSNNGECFGKN